MLLCRKAARLSPLDAGMKALGSFGVSDPANCLSDKGGIHPDTTILVGGSDSVNQCLSYKMSGNPLHFRPRRHDGLMVCRSCSLTKVAMDDRQRNGDDVPRWTAKPAIAQAVSLFPGSPTVGIKCALCEQLDSSNRFRAASTMGRARSKGAGRVGAELMGAATRPLTRSATPRALRVRHRRAPGV